MEPSTSLCKNFAIIDMQGFALRNCDFILKEICILTNDGLKHWIFQPPTSIEEFTAADRCCINWTSRNYHKIQWNSGFEKYEEAQKLISLALNNVEKIYVKGLQKCDWIKKFLVKNIEIINVEDINCHFKLKDDIYYRFSCTFHSGICSVYNVFKIYCWFKK